MKSIIINGTEYTEVTYRLDGEDMPGILIHDLNDTYRDGDGIIGNGAELPENEEDARMLANEHVETNFRLVNGIYNLDPMTYGEYMEEHPDENLSWCKPYKDESGKYTIVMYEGKPESAMTPDGELYRSDDTLNDEAITKIAKAVNPDYDKKDWFYTGWSDLHIALDVMYEAGCSECPFAKGMCDAMSEEMSETDYR